jgi:hypothetical protein
VLDPHCPRGGSRGSQSSIHAVSARQAHEMMHTISSIGSACATCRDCGHAISALRRSERERERGDLTKDEFDRIQRKAKSKLKKKRTT